MKIDAPTVAQTVDGAPRKELGARLRRLRRRAKLTQNEVATRLQVTKQAISNWEKGLHEPHRRHKRALADLYGVPEIEISKRYDFTPDTSGAQPYKRTDLDPSKLIEARHNLGLTQKQAGAPAGLSKTAICQYETGARIPSADAMLRLAAAYGKPLSWFMKVPTDAGTVSPVSAPDDLT